MSPNIARLGGWGLGVGLKIFKLTYSCQKLTKKVDLWNKSKNMRFHRLLQENITLSLRTAHLHTWFKNVQNRCALTGICWKRVWTSHTWVVALSPNRVLYSYTRRQKLSTGTRYICMCPWRYINATFSIKMNVHFLFNIINILNHFSTSKGFFVTLVCHRHMMSRNRLACTCYKNISHSYWLRRELISRQNYNFNIQDFSCFSTNGCRADTKRRGTCKLKEHVSNPLL